MKNAFRLSAGLVVFISVLAAVIGLMAACEEPAPDPEPVVERVTVNGNSVIVKGESATFTATVTGTNLSEKDMNVTWSIDQTDVNQGTSINSSGKLTVAAGESRSSLRVRATSTTDDSVSGTKTVSIQNPAQFPVVSGVSIDPKNTTVQKGGNFTFTATVTGTNLAEEDKTVAWSIEQTNKNAGTSIDSAGKLTVAAAETLATLTVKAVSDFDDTQFDTATVTVQNPPPVVSGVSIDPKNTTVQKGGNRTFTATVTGTNLAEEDKTVSWSIEQAGKNAGTSIDSAGKLTVAAGETLAALTVKAVSDLNDTKFDTATVTVSEGNGNTSMLTMSATTSRPNVSLFTQNSPGSDYISITVNNINSYSGSSFRLDYTITDIFGTALEQNSIEYLKSGGNSQTKQIPLDKSRLGHFTLTPVIPGGAPSLPVVGSRPAGFITYAVVVDPAHRRQKAPYGSQDVDKYIYFGMYLVPTGTYNGINMIEYLGLDATISSELNWKENFNTGSATDVNKLNTYQASSLTSTFYVLGDLTSYMPPWARTAAGQAGSYGGELSAYGEAEFVKYMKGIAKIHIEQSPNRPRHYYQILWEPVDYWGGWSPRGGTWYGPFGNNPDWADQGGDAALVRVYELAYQAVHEAYDQKAAATGDSSWSAKPVILGPTYSSMGTGTDWWDGYRWHEFQFQNGLANYIDGLSIHPYDPSQNAQAGGDGSTGAGDDLLMANSAKRHMDLVRSSYASRTTPRYFDTPFFWGTEQGMIERNNADVKGRPATVARLLTRYNLIMMGEGFDANHSFCFSDYDEDRYGFFYNLTNMNNSNDIYAPNVVSPKHAAPALAATSWLLKGYRTAGRLSLSGTNLGYKYQDNESSSVIYAVWNYEGTSTVNLNVGANSVTVYDIMGNAETKPAPGGMLNITLTESVQYIKVGN